MATLHPDLHQKFRKAKPLLFRQSGDGTESIEVREDEEQPVRLQEIIDLLVAAGYFRARIKGLSPFDKIVGGMTWCIESCNVDIDVDLLFQENSTIGQKIALTEKIVAVLPKMKCPHRLEPHQIQGLDCLNIFPVIQWLVKRSMEFRQEMSSFVRSYAVSQFNKEFIIENKLANAQKQVLENVNTVRELYRPHIYYRRKTAPLEDLHSRIEATLLEYGITGDILGPISKSIGPESIEQESAQEDTEHFILNDEERLELRKHYASLQSEMQVGGVMSREEKQIWALEKQKQIIVDRCSKITEEISTMEKQIDKTVSHLDEINQKEEEANKALSQLNIKEKEHTGNLTEVEELVILNDNLKMQELQFRDYCKQELARLKDIIQKMQTTNVPENNNTNNIVELAEETDRLKNLRLQTAKKNRSIATVQRKLDEIPSRAELAQYQKRFLELYNQVSAKHKETKQYFTLYNTLDDTRFYIKKELTLLNSISDSYPEALSSNSNKEEFLKQFEAKVEGVKLLKQKAEDRLSKEKNKRDELSYNLQSLIEQQRRYAAAVRQLTIECRKHEVLLAEHSA